MQNHKLVLSIVIIVIFSPIPVNAETCDGGGFSSYMARLGFSELKISNDVRLEENIHKLSEKSRQMTYEQASIFYSKFREYSLDNLENVMGGVPKIGEVVGKKRDKAFDGQIAKLMTADIYEYENEKLAWKAYRVYGQGFLQKHEDYHAAVGSYYILSQNDDYKVAELADFMSYCNTPLYKIFRDGSTRITLPDGWSSYNEEQADISDIETLRERFTEKKNTKLIEAIHQYNFYRRDEDVDRVVALIKKEESLNGVDHSSNRTALHLVLFGEDQSIIDMLVPMLIDRGVNCDVQDKYGVSPLMLAAQQNMKLVESLIACGADPEKKSQNGRSAMDYADSANKSDVLEFLSSH